MKNKFYITTTIPYVNADPHIGFALELIQADVIARYQRSLGNEVVFNMGADEHGVKIYRKALEQGKEPQAYVDEYAARFARLKDALNISWTLFVRTTDPHHKLAAQEFWNRCLVNGFIYKKNYKVKYCVGCELEKTDSELVNEHCPIHPNLSIEEIDEENYFFKFSEFQEPLLKFYDQHPDFVVPEFRFREIKKFIEQGLHDFSVSRLKSKMPWGVPVPDDSEQVMYVWFDALVNYISTLGWPENNTTFSDFWPGVQIAGKDNLRQQSAIWQAMLMAAKLPNSRQILIHGFVNANGQKMSKSLGNVIDPFEVVKKYGTDPVRYYLLREIPSGDDGDFSYEKLETRYNGDLANGLGNFSSRVLAMGAKVEFDGSEKQPDYIADKIREKKDLITTQIHEFRLHDALATLWSLISVGDAYINEKEVWKSQDRNDLFGLVLLLKEITVMLLPFLPATAQKISSNITQDDGVLKVQKSDPLFPRLT